MSYLANLAKQMALVNSQMDVTQQRVRYNGVELRPRPFIKDIGMDDGYKSTDTIRDAVRRWEILAYPDNLRGLIIDEAFNDFAFGQWEISEDGGRSWLKTFLDSFPIRGPHAYRLTLARGFTDANLTITYQSGQGTFTTVNGNPTEATTEETVYASVSQGRTRSQLVNVHGNPPSQIYLEGYFTNVQGEPLSLPTDLPLQRPWPATLQIGGGMVSGQFTPVVLAQNAWPANEDRRGSTCQGLFTTSGTGQ